MNEYKNISSVTKELTNLNFEVVENASTNQEIKELRKVIDYINYGVYFISFIICMLFIIIFKYIYKDEEKNMALLKVLGYKSRTINNIMLLKLLLLILISNILLILCQSLSYIILNLEFLANSKHIFYILAFQTSLLFLLSLKNYTKIKKLRVLEKLESIK